MYISWKIWGFFGGKILEALIDLNETNVLGATIFLLSSSSHFTSISCPKRKYSLVEMKVTIDF